MKKIFFAAIILLSYQSQAQNANQKAVEEAATLSHSGAITHPIEDGKWLNINYSISPRVLNDEMNIMLHTPYAEPVTLAILDKSDRKVMEWTEQQDVYLKRDKINVSHLAKGKYSIVIYHKGIEAKRFTITKD